MTRPLTGEINKLLVNDKKEIRNESMTHQYFPLWLQIKQSCEVKTVFVTLNLLLSGRGEAEFCRNSESTDTHYSVYSQRYALC